MENYEKLYKEAIERASKIYNKEKVTGMELVTCEEIFPELKESEGERIRKEIIDFLRLPHPQFVGKRDHEKWLAWLEKQDIKLQEYINKERNKKDFYCEGKEMSWNEISLNVRKHDYPYYFKGDLDCYPFNIEKQGGRKLTDKIEPKSAWSEEDEKMKSLIIATLTSMGTLNLERYHHINLDEVKNWLKSLKDRVQPQPKQQWSEEGDKQYKKILDLLSGIGVIDDLTYEESQELQDYFKSLKPNHWKPSEEQMQALKYVVDYFGELTEHFVEYDELKSLYNDFKNFEK